MMNIIRTIRREILELPASEKKLKDFAFLVGGIFVALAFFVIVRGGGGPIAYGVVTGGFALIILGFAAPRALLVPYRLWMSIGIVIGYFVFRTLLLGIFFTIFAPLGILMRALRRDVLRLRPPNEGGTLWVSAEKPQDMREPY